MSDKKAPPSFLSRTEFLGGNVFKKTDETGKAVLIDTNSNAVFYDVDDVSFAPGKKSSIDVKANGKIVNITDPASLTKIAEAMNNAGVTPEGTETAIQLARQLVSENGKRAR
jgi:hypothetical protein